MSKQGKINIKKLRGIACRYGLNSYVDDQSGFLIVESYEMLDGKRTRLENEVSREDEIHQIYNCHVTN